MVLGDEIACLVCVSVKPLSALKPSLNAGYHVTPFNLIIQFNHTVVAELIPS